ncbi:MAG: hypothetical protein ABFS42_09260 [Candidatus Krumholzibacteriota bacterium]
MPSINAPMSSRRATSAATIRPRELHLQDGDCKDQQEQDQQEQEQQEQQEQDQADQSEEEQEPTESETEELTREQALQILKALDRDEEELKKSVQKRLKGGKPKSGKKW